MYKNKFTKYFVTIILVFALLFTAVACVQPDGNGSADEELAKYKYDGIHDLTAPDSETDFLIQNGRTNYTLLVPQNATKEMGIAKSEFIELFKRAGNVAIQTVKDNEVDTHSPTACYISLGDNLMAQSANIPNYDKSQLTPEGLRIYTKDKTIYLLGGSDAGVIQAVYRFMEIYFDFDQFYRNCVTYNTVGPNDVVPLKLFDVTDVPDIPYRSLYYSQIISTNADTMMDSDTISGATSNDILYRGYRFGCNASHYTVLQPTYTSYADQASKDMTYEQMMQDVTLQPKVTGSSAYVHNTTELMPQGDVPSKYANSTSGWYSDIGVQLCYTAHGDPESFEAFTSECAKKIIGSLILNPRESAPTVNAVGVLIEDTAGYCNCAACTEAFNRDGQTYTGSVIRFCERLAEKIHAWMDLPGNEAYKRPDFQVVFFAYSGMTKAPTIYNKETKKYELANSDCAMSKNTCVYIIPKFATMQYSFSQETKVQIEARELLESWSAVASNMWIWTHGLNYTKTSYPHNMFNHQNNELYQMYAHFGVKFLFDECNSGGTNGTAFFNLRTYVQSKLMWDSTKDMNTLIDAYFTNMYQDAAKYMKAYFEASTIHEAKVVQQYADVQEGDLSAILQPYMYPLQTLYGWFDMFDAAYQSIERYKYTNSNLYNTIKDRIDMEYISPLFVLVSLYCDVNTNYLTSEDRLMYVNKIKALAEGTQFNYNLGRNYSNLKAYAKELK